MSIPVGELPVPPEVLEHADGQPAVCVWENGIGGTTWTYEGAEGPVYMKVGPKHPEFDVEGEASRLEWLGQYLPVPCVLGYDSDGERTWFETEGIIGTNAIAPENIARAEVVVPALGRGLRRFHDALKEQDCPYSWSAESRIALLTEPFDEAVPSMRPRDLVVCHGDACNPNFLVDEDGEVCGYVDLSRAGIADRHADLAPALMSLGWNFGPGWDEAFLGAYCGRDLTVDPERIVFYQRLWDAV